MSSDWRGVLPGQKDGRRGLVVELGGWLRLDLNCFGCCTSSEVESVQLNPAKQGGNKNYILP